MNTADISPVLLVTGYPTNLIVAWQNRRGLKPRVWLPPAALVLAGCIPGAFMLKNVDARLIKFIFGFVVVALGVEMLLRERRREKRPASKPVLALIGVLAGVLCGLFGVGALMAAYVGRVTETNSEFKANINAVFFVEGTFRLILYLCPGPDYPRLAAPVADPDALHAGGYFPRLPLQQKAQRDGRQKTGDLHADSLRRAANSSQPVTVPAAACGARG